jgi:hypothetical protein
VPAAIAIIQANVDRPALSVGEADLHVDPDRG